ncbi:MAG: sensor histidine kinase, partial [Phenylobacterium sp.]|nr:sensor histidine kinase [Phenylobacterium sp.]
MAPATADSGMTSRWRRSPLRLRPLAFTLFAMITVLGAVAFAFYLVDLSAEDVFLDREHDSAMAERQILREAYRLEGIPGLVTRMERRARLAAPEQHYALFDPAGRHLGGDLLTPPNPSPDGGWRKARSLTHKGPIALYATTARLADGSLLVIGRDAAGQRAYESRSASGLVIGLAIVVAASLGVGLLLNALVIQRAGAVAGVAERIAAGDL